MTANAGGGAEPMVRAMSGLALAVPAVLTLAIGGHAFAVFCGVVGALAFWELARISSPGLGLARCAGAAAACFLALTAISVSALEPGYLLAAAAAAIAAILVTGRVRFICYGIPVAVCVIAFPEFRESYGIKVALWVILVAVATDVCGYFGGRAFGGPRLAPRISPGKRWSGVVAGWAGAAAVGVALAGEFRGAVVGGSLLMSASAQVGDMAESALKRHAGIKDSSSLIPGHGGVLDRFDGVVGAGVCALLLSSLGLFGAWTG